MIKIQFYTPSEKEELILEYQNKGLILIEEAYTFDGNFIYFDKESVDNRLKIQERRLQEQEQAIMELTALLSGGGVNV
ncbi:hypothetical protein QN089_05670 [Kurthia sp. YJT4]|uniref:hypothetical protein n=1 Tax=Kurthia sp. YJT4 TaxID=3049086 RepID=UPI00254F18CC|nr:hypothetical protein [Kurthia sp. YJT4]WIL39757.1 hypothetical protein QN089_05670 [Kurthia sp. YJT4]